MAARWWPLLVLLGAAVAAATLDCRSTAACLFTCGTALALEGATEEVAERCEVQCDATHRRCACTSASAPLMLAGGSCAAEEDAGGPAGQPDCTGTHEALFYVAAAISPEVQAEHVVSGAASQQLVAILRLGTAAGLQWPLRNVSIVEVVLMRGEFDLNGTLAARGVVQFDLTFGFCATSGTAAGQLLAEPQLQDFEQRFRLEVQRFATFHGASLNLVRLTSLRNATTLTTPATTPVPLSSIGGAGGGPSAAVAADDDGESHEAGWVLAATLVALAAGAALSGAALLAARRRFGRSRIEACELGDEPQGETSELPAPLDEDAGQAYAEAVVEDGRADGAEEGSEVTVVLAPVVCAFDPGAVEVGDDEAASWMRESCLELQKGEVVQVTAAVGSGWLYGCIAGRPERAGCFPESCVPWHQELHEGAAAGEQVNTSQPNLEGTPDPEVSSSRDAAADGESPEAPAAPPEDLRNLAAATTAGLAAGPPHVATSEPPLLE